PERAPTLSADRVAPDDLVHQPVAEDLVELHANVVHGTPVEMDEERAARREHAMESDEAGTPPGEVGLQMARIGVTAGRAAAPRSGSERRVDVDEVEAAIGEAAEDLEVVGADQCVHLCKGWNITA